MIKRWIDHIESDVYITYKRIVANECDMFTSKYHDCEQAVEKCAPDNPRAASPRAVNRRFSQLATYLPNAIGSLPTPASPANYPSGSEQDESKKGSRGSCKRSKPKLSIAEESYYDDVRKSIRFRCDVKRNPEAVVLVQWLRGDIYFEYIDNDNGERKIMRPLLYELVGKNVRPPFEPWHVDSKDEDPVSWSQKGQRWNYTVIDSKAFEYHDFPSGPSRTTEFMPRSVQAMRFKTCLHCAADVPTQTDLLGTNIGEPISCIEWEASTVREWNKVPTHPPLTDGQ